MAKKTFRVKLYYPHDLDLISLMITHEMNFSKALYCAIKSFCKNEAFAIKIPPKRVSSLPKRRKYHKDLNLDTEKDMDEIELLMKITPGYRNNFLKNLLRLYLLHPATEDFLVDQTEMPLFEDYFNVFRKNLKVADAAALKSIQRKKKTAFEKEKQTEPNSTNNIQQNTEVLVSDENKKRDELISEQNAEDSEELTDLFASLLS